MAGKLKTDLPGWQNGFQGMGLTVLLMTVIVAAMIFSFWICRAGPFSTEKAAEPVYSAHGEPVVNPGSNALHAYAGENNSSDFGPVLNKLQNSLDNSSQ
jgi:hypothetical protein